MQLLLLIPERNAYRQGSGGVWTDEVRCQGGELDLSQCSHNGWRQEDVAALIARAQALNALELSVS